MLFLRSSRALSRRFLSLTIRLLLRLLGARFFLLRGIFLLLRFICVRHFLRLVLLVSLLLLGIDLGLSLSTALGLLVGFRLVLHLILRRLSGSFAFAFALSSRLALGLILGASCLLGLLLRLFRSRLLLLQLLLGKVDSRRSAENLLHWHADLDALKRLLLEFLLELEALLVLALLNDAADDNDSPDREPVRLVVGLGELALDALPDFLTRRASSLVEGEEGHLNHLQVGVL